MIGRTSPDFTALWIRRKLEKMRETNLSALESKVDELIALCNALVRENQSLREQQQSWLAERARLVERNELAKTKIDTMIGRLKMLDKES